MKNIFKSEFAKNVAWISGGTAFVQFLAIAFSPLLTRLYTPADFGVFTLYNSFLSILLIISTLKYENAIPITNNKIEGLAVGLCAFITLSINALLFFVIFFIFSENILGMFDALSLNKYVLLIPLGILLAGTYNILLQWALKEKQFKSITKTKISQGLGMNVTQVSIGYFQPSGLGLILGNIIGKSAGIITLFKKLKYEEKSFFKMLSLKKIKWAFRRYRKFPIVNMPAQILSSGGLELPVFLISGLYGATVIGQFGLAHMVVSIPITLIGTAIGDVFYAEAATNGRKDPKNLLKLAKKLFKKLLIFGSIPTLILLIFGPFLFQLVFGNQWKTAGEFAQIIALLGLVRMVFTPITHVFVVFEKLGLSFALNTFRVFVILSSFGIANYFDFNYFNAVKLYVAGVSVFYLLNYFFAIQLIKNRITQ